MYIKSFQNGNPVIMAYRVTPYTKEETPVSTQTAADASNTDLAERLTKLEHMLTKLTDEGGKFNGLL
jgi:hypothetical protein